MYDIKTNKFSKIISLEEIYPNKTNTETITKLVLPSLIWMLNSLNHFELKIEDNHFNLEKKTSSTK